MISELPAVLLKGMARLGNAHRPLVFTAWGSIRKPIAEISCRDEHISAKASKITEKHKRRTKVAYMSYVESFKG